MDVGFMQIKETTSRQLTVWYGCIMHRFCCKGQLFQAELLQIVLAVFYPCFIHLWTFAKPRGVADAFKAYSNITREA